MSTFTSAELRLLAASDRVLEANLDETPRQREARWSAESRQRVIDRLGLDGWREHRRAIAARAVAKRGRA